MSLTCVNEAAPRERDARHIRQVAVMSAMGRTDVGVMTAWGGNRHKRFRATQRRPRNKTPPAFQPAALIVAVVQPVKRRRERACGVWLAWLLPGRQIRQASLPHGR